MEIHAPAATLNDRMLSDLKAQHQKQKAVAPFEDPIREFHRAGSAEGMVRNWLTLSVEERRKQVATLAFRPRYMGDASRNVEPESEQAYKNRIMERWRALMGIIQEETRAAMFPEKFTHSAEVAITALKFAMPDHPWGKGK